MASIAFTDGTGAATLTNSKTGPALRFRNWNPDDESVKAEAEALGTGQPYPFVFSTRPTVTFSLDKIPQSQQAVALRLVRWLEGGGVVTVNTADAAARSYASMYLKKGTRPSYTLTNPSMLEYTFTVTLVNTAGTALLCQY